MNLKSLLLASLSLALVALVRPASADAEPSLNLAPRWSVGDTARYTSTKTKIRSENGKVLATQSSSTPMGFEILEAGTDGYTLEWTLGRTVIEGLAADTPEARFVKALVDLLAGTRIRVRLGAGGDVERILNLSEARGKAMQAIDLMINHEKDATDAAVLSQVREVMKKLLDNEETFAAITLKELRLLLAAYGKEYRAGEALSYESELSNPLGGQPFASVIEYELTGIDADTGRATVTISQNLRDVGLGQVLGDSLKPPPGDEQVDDLMRNMRLNLFDEGTVIIDLKRGWPESIEHIRRVSAEDKVNQEIIELQRVD